MFAGIKAWWKVAKLTSLKQRAIDDSKNKIIISCTPWCSVIRTPNREPYYFGMSTIDPFNCTIEDQLDSIYIALCTFESMFANSSNQLHDIEIRTPYKRLVLGTTIDACLNKKALIIISKIYNMKTIWENKIDIVYRKLNSTYDFWIK